MRHCVLIFDFKVAVYEDKVTHDAICNPFKFVSFEKVLVLIPCAPVLTLLLGDVLDMVLDELLGGGVRLSTLPEIVYLFGLDQVHVEDLSAILTGHIC